VLERKRTTEKTDVSKESYERERGRGRGREGERQQGDQMSLWKKAAKMKPEKLLAKINMLLFLSKKQVQKFGPLL
jgi:hypothetical protein